MFRRIAGVLVVAMAVTGIVLAEDTTGIVTKVEDGSITIRTGFGKDNIEEKTYKVGKGVSVSKVVKDKDDVKLSLADLKTAVRVTNVFATITHEGDNVSAIKVGGGFGGFGGFKGKGKKKDN